jgi:antitoxin (DNA-binding transcriptional repressor) of toxin-antitoxin stability system
MLAWSRLRRHKRPARAALTRGGTRSATGRRQEAIMPVVNMHEAKTHLAELVRRVQQGETFIIARAGRPMAQLTRLGGSPAPRRPGSLAGVIRMDEEVGMPEPAQIHGPVARGLRVVARGGTFSEQGDR